MQIISRKIVNTNMRGQKLSMSVGLRSGTLVRNVLTGHSYCIGGHPCCDISWQRTDQERLAMPHSYKPVTSRLRDE